MRRWSAPLLLLAGLAAAATGCSDRRPRGKAKGGLCVPASSRAACDGGDPYECQWGELLRAHGDVSRLAAVIDGAPADRDALLRRLFPAIGSKSIADRPLPVPPGLVFDHPDFDPYRLPTPIDWRADPFANVSWRLFFQTLSWLPDYRTADELDAGAALLVDWVDRALYADPPLDQSWEDHAVSLRLDRAAGLTSRYIASRSVLSRQVLYAAAQLIVTHLYALAADCCYGDAHNHALMHDLAILTHAPRYPALRAGAAMVELARRRLIERQVRHSVSADGVHAENTPAYHFFYLELLNRAIALDRDAGRQPPAKLVETRDSMIEPLVQLLQPDLSFPQFGDGDDADQSERLAKLLDRTRRLGASEAVLAPLEWVVSRGQRGVAPRLDVVYQEGGYAVFRDRWDVASGEGTVAHFKTSHRSGVHYHADETSFEIFAHGRELVVEPGAFTYAAGDPFLAYQRSPAGQNVLVVDGDGTVVNKPNAASRVIAHEIDRDVAWVQGGHANYRHLGVSSLVRTFAFARPDTFVVIDHVRARERHDYAQHFHLHPDLSELRVVDARTVVASVPGGPGLVIAAAEPRSIETPRGVADGAVRRGWYFPRAQVKQPAYDVILHATAADADLAVVIALSAPGQPARTPSAVEYRADGDAAAVSWELDGVRRSVRVPLR